LRQMRQSFFGPRSDERGRRTKCQRADQEARAIRSYYDSIVAEEDRRLYAQLIASEIVLVPLYDEDFCSPATQATNVCSYRRLQRRERHLVLHVAQKPMVQRGTHKMKKTILAFSMLGSAAFGLTGAAIASPAGSSLLGVAIAQTGGAQHAVFRRCKRLHGRGACRHVYGYRGGNRRLPDADLRWGQWEAWHRNWY
jgi:hypothetical protein